MAGFGAGVRYGVHSNSLVNLARGIVERVFYVDNGSGLECPPKPKDNIFNLRLSGLRERLLHKLRPTPIVDRCDYADLYTGRKRGVYQRAWESLKASGVNLKDAWVNTFVKAEKVNFQKKGDPAPRVIQPRSSRYNLEVGRYLKLFEKEMFAGFKRVFGYAVVSKGMNASETGELLASHWSRFRNPVAVGLDAKRFDQHVSKMALEFEHSFYNSVFGSKELAKLLKWQLKNRGIARIAGHRVDYTVEGCRMSGDINTGLGNCILMSCMVISYCEHYNINYRLVNNGDDCVLFAEKEDLARFDAIGKWFLDFGFTLTREPPVYTLEHVEFCQAQPVFTANGWRMVRDPRTAMSKDCVSLVGWDTPVHIRAWAGAIGSCGASLTGGVPVWSAWYNRLVELGGRRKENGVDAAVRDSGLGYMAKGVKSCKVSAECRVSFYKAFGILPDMQEALEEHYSSLSFGTEVHPMMFPDVKVLDQKINPLATWLTTGDLNNHRQ